MTPTSRLAPLSIVGTLAFLGLAILGWGGLSAFFSNPARIALTIAVFVMSGAALFSGGNLSPGEREDRSNRWVLVVFGVIGLLAAYLPAYTDRMEFWTGGPKHRGRGLGGCRCRGGGVAILSGARRATGWHRHVPAQ